MKVFGVTGLILAGGKARRMGGMDKGLLQLEGETMVERIAGKLAQQCDEVLINANRHTGEYQNFGYKVIEDELKNFQGPLAGMLTGLKIIQTEWLLTVPCDGPFLSEHYATKMSEAVESSGTKLAIAASVGRLQPVYALLHQSLWKSLESYLAGGERKVDRWYDQHEFAVVDYSDDEEMFENINTPEQLDECIRKIRLSDSTFPALHRF